LLDLATRPLDADFAAESYIQLYLYVHRVRDLAPGVYKYWPEETRLELVKSGDQRVMRRHSVLVRIWPEIPASLFR